MLKLLAPGPFLGVSALGSPFSPDQDKTKLQDSKPFWRGERFTLLHFTQTFWDEERL